MPTNTSVFGVFHEREQLNSAVKVLKDAGFRNSDISVLFPDRRGTFAPEGAAAGAGTGVAVGGTLGWLAGIGALAIPGLGPFIAAGPIMAAMAGAEVGGLVGGMTGALVGMGIPEYEAERYEGMVKDGGFLISVHAEKSEWAKKGKRLLEACGAKDVASAGEEFADTLPSEIAAP